MIDTLTRLFAVSVQTGSMSNHPFDLLMELATDQIRLDCAALHLARDVFPGLNLEHYLSALDELAQRVAALRPGLAANLRYQAMREVLVGECGLTGNRDAYYDPDNSYLNRVIDSGVGIPISLSIVWVEVARRLKWPVAGVALPGHFIVRFDDRERFVLADPFHDGRSLAVKDCRRLVRERFGDKMTFTTALLEPADARAILVRVLQNLRNIYLAQNDLPRVANILRRMAAVEPQNGRHLQELAAVYCRRGDVRGAYAHLALYLRRSPHAHDSRRVRQNLQLLQAALVALN
jgi:regulator of sirC expression with transglutaminase-like and TPR domain